VSNYAVLDSFDEFNDGGGPSFLVLGKDGNFYGTASTGGYRRAPARTMKLTVPSFA